jgi:hypothetical protein
MVVQSVREEFQVGIVLVVVELRQPLREVLEVMVQMVTLQNAVKVEVEVVLKMVQVTVPEVMVVMADFREVVEEEVVMVKEPVQVEMLEVEVEDKYGFILGN